MRNRAGQQAGLLTSGRFGGFDDVLKDLPPELGVIAIRHVINGWRQYHMAPTATTLKRMRADKGFAFQGACAAMNRRWYLSTFRNSIAPISAVLWYNKDVPRENPTEYDL